MARQTEILSKLGRILKEHCHKDPGKLSPDLRLQEDLALDSLALLTLAVEVENEFQIYLNEDAEHPPQTLGDLVVLIQNRLSNPNG